MEKATGEAVTLVLISANREELLGKKKKSGRQFQEINHKIMEYTVPREREREQQNEDNSLQKNLRELVGDISREDNLRDKESREAGNYLKRLH